VPIDRDSTGRRAEHLIRQGKLDGAIAEYVRRLEEHPDDWIFGAKQEPDA
jgi:hypothetical protein